MIDLFDGVAAGKDRTGLSAFIEKLAADSRAV
jgi:hypothetical protein